MTTSNGYAGRDELLDIRPRRYRDVEIPMYDLKFCIRSLTEAERSQHETETTTAKSGDRKQRMQTAKTRLIVKCVVAGPDQDEPILRVSDVDILAGQDAVITATIFDAICEHCGYIEADIEEAVKNSEGTHDAALQSN